MVTAILQNDLFRYIKIGNELVTCHLPLRWRRRPTLTLTPAPWLCPRAVLLTRDRHVLLGRIALLACHQDAVPDLEVTNDRQCVVRHCRHFTRHGQRYGHECLN